MAGLYFVSSFYILNGVAMMIVYGRYPLTKPLLLDFFVKRLFRIMPLFWLVTGIAVAHICAGVIRPPQNFTTVNLFLSLTGLFSWFEPRAYFSAGMWSIGNELAFYSLFPFILYSLKRLSVFFSILILGSIASFIWADAVLLDNVGTSFQWDSYIHPLNQLCFFSSGILIGWALNENHLSASRQQHALLLILGILLFILASSLISRDQAIVGTPKFLMFLICNAMSVGAAGWAMTGYAGGVLEWLGKISYSLYLLHWPVYLWVHKYLLPGKDPLFVIVTTVLASVALSTLSYIGIEATFVRAGKMISRQLQRLMAL